MNNLADHMSAQDIWKSILLSSGRALRKNYLAFIPTALIAFFSFYFQGKALLVLPLVFSFYAIQAGRSFGLVDPPELHWWVARTGYYFLLLLWFVFLALFILPLITYAVLGTVIGTGEANSDYLLNFTTVFWLLLTSVSCLRLWPILSTSFLVEGTEHYTNPLALYFPWHRYPIWTGPGLFDTWQWTKHKKVLHYLTPIAGTCVLFGIGGLYCTYLLLPQPGYARVIVLALFSFALFPFLFLVNILCSWHVIVINRRSPSVVSPPDFELPVPGLSEQIYSFEKDRFYIDRFPGGGERLVLIFPSEVIEESREVMLSELYQLNPSRSFKEGEFVEMWSDEIEMQNDVPPDLIIDFQRSVLAVSILSKTSTAYQRFWRLMFRWNRKFPIRGLDCL